MSNFDDSEIPKHRSKKSTKRWCKGKKGVLHDFTWKSCATRNFPDWFDYSCDKCGKVEDRWYPYMLAFYSDPKPVVGSKEPLTKKRIEKHEI